MDDLFEQRKRDHIQLATNPETQCFGMSEFERIRIIHEALPEMNLDEVDIRPSLFSEFEQRDAQASFNGVNSSFKEVRSPLFISSMTAGHKDSLKINSSLVECCSHRQWMMGVGSQRRELTDFTAQSEWVALRKKYPKVSLMSNIGLSQVIVRDGLDSIQRIINSLEACALIIHLNPLQEALQPEGTPQFRDGLKTISEIVKRVKIPVIIKEVGCGISPQTCIRLQDAGVFAIDVSGLGGTHWGRIETLRSKSETLLNKVGMEFKNWGIPTATALLEAVEILRSDERNSETKNSNKASVWASGGIRNGIDACKMLALGADMVGIAQPFILAALKGPEAVDELMQKFEEELRISMFCSGIREIAEFKKRKVWQWQKS